METENYHSPGINLTRRNLITSGTGFVVSATMMLQGCVISSSDHRKNRIIAKQSPVSVISATPLKYDVEKGFAKLNEIRKKYLLPEFKKDPRLQKAAQDYASLMGARGLYGHEIGPGTDFKSRILAAGYNNSSGENIGVGYRSVDDALKGWLDSPGHRKNMLKRHYTIAGLAYGFNTSGRNPRFTHYWVLIMGKANGIYS